MMDEATQIWLAFHSVPEQEQREWLQSILQAIRDQDRQIEFYKHAWQTCVLLKRNTEARRTDIKPGRLI